MSDECVSRRKFLEAGIFVISGAIALGVGGSALTSIGAPAVTNKREGKWVDVGSSEEFKPGEFQKVSIVFDDKDGWLEDKFKMLAYVRVEPEGIFALSATCSHLGCNVNLDEETGGFKCPCHTGIYDKNGKNISGPPPHALKRLDAKIEEGRLLINTAPKEA